MCVIIYTNVTESTKTNLTCTSDCTHLMSHSFSCELANNTKPASFIVLCLVSLLSNLYTNSLPTG